MYILQTNIDYMVRYVMLGTEFVAVVAIKARIGIGAYGNWASTSMRSEKGRYILSGQGGHARDVEGFFCLANAGRTVCQGPLAPFSA